MTENHERFRLAVKTHDRLYPAHTTHGIGCSFLDLDRLGLEEGEELWPGISVFVDGRVAGAFRVLCDGEDDHPDPGAMPYLIAAEQIRSRDAFMRRLHRRHEEERELYERLSR